MSKPRLLRTLSDGSVWPVDGQLLADLEWDLRYADDEHALEQRLHAASVVSAYAALLAMSQRDRNAKVAQIRGAALAIRAERRFEENVGPIAPLEPRTKEAP